MSKISTKSAPASKQPDFDKFLKEQKEFFEEVYDSPSKVLDDLAEIKKSMESDQRNNQ